MAASNAIVPPRRSGLPAPIPPTTTSYAVRRFGRDIDNSGFKYFEMAKTSLSAGSSKDQHTRYSIGKVRYSHQGSSSASSSATSVPLPQCKVKRNYACIKCSYYTQNPRSFLHHQKNVHSERLRVYECSQCLYASKHSQKLQRHVHMVHKGSKSKKSHKSEHADGRPLLVPPVRIRVHRIDKNVEKQFGELVVVEDVDVERGERQGMEDEDEIDEENDSDQSSEDQDMSRESDLQQAVVPKPSSSKSSKSHKKHYKQEKHSATYVRCSVCSFGSHSQTLVNRHEKLAHLKKKFFRCMKCNYVTHMRARYTKHVKYHTMPMIKCDDCDFRTPYKWNLDRHNRNHSTIAPGTYKCSHCSFSADIKQSLTVHETNHHVPPVGGVFPIAAANRRRYRVGASDAPGSAVDGTEIVTYETSKGDGIVEIMTETKSAASTTTAASAGNSSSKSITSATATKNNSDNSSNSNEIDTNQMVISVAGGGATITPVPSSIPLTIASITKKQANQILATKDNSNAPHRRPLPRLIPIVEQQQRHIPTIIRLRKRVSAPDNSNVQITTVIPVNNDYYNVVNTGKSALSDFASLIDEQYDVVDGPVATFNSSTVNRNDSNVATGSGCSSNSTVTSAGDRRRSGSSTGSGGSAVSPKSKTASFFDKLKAKVDETADLTCSVCRFESKCLSEFMRHQRTHDEDDNDNNVHQIVVIDKNEKIAVPLPPMPPVTAAELKSTRCQRCRKRCKTSTELMVHLATCRGAVAVATVAPSAVTVDGGNFRPVTAARNNSDADKGGSKQQHPMENKIFVWNTAAAVPATHDDGVAAATKNKDDDDEKNSVTITEIVMPADVRPVETTIAKPEVHREEVYASSSNSLQLERHRKHNSIRREGKMFKTVFKCPHCTFWAATASRFHVHIVGHLNRKPFECSCCAYRSNWRWDITKHIRLKSVKRAGGDYTNDASNSHHGAKVLMTDETGRRNYSKYNRYLTVMEMDVADGADKAAGGDCEDGRGTVRKVVGGGVTRKRRTVAMNKGQIHYKQKTVHIPSSDQTVTMSGGGGSGKKIVAEEPDRNQENNAIAQSPSSPVLLASSTPISDNRSKTIWKCKKCFFRDCDRLTVLNHVKAHYRRGEFGSSDSQSVSQQNSPQHTRKKIKIKNIEEQDDITEQRIIINDIRKSIKVPTTGTTTDSLLMLSTNPKSCMLYNDENFLSCPLCDMTASNPGELKNHMQSTHIPEETKYRCEYCPYWSEEKKAMLDHMIFAHEMDDGSVNTDVNASEVTYQQDEIKSNSNDIHSRDNDEEVQGLDITGSSNDTSVNISEVFDNGSSDDMTATANMEVVFETSDENIVVVETVECKTDYCDDDTILTTPSKGSEKSSYSSATADDKMNDMMISCEYEGSEEQDDELVEDEEIIVRAEEVINLNKTKFNTSNVVETTINKFELKGNQVYECGNCWYFSTNKKDISAHKQLHVERGALYNCSQCVFNVTKASVLYHHYRYGHVIEEPELRYPEDSVVRAGHRDMVAKNSENKFMDKTVNDEIDDITVPPMVWYYHKDSVPSFTKVFKCRYCPHTNRRRHNTIEHERMHSDHPEHQNHRLQQQRLTGCSSPQIPLHPCKRCTYVCNNAGVLASHCKVHSTSYSYSTVGFYDSTIADKMQIQALEYVIELEQNLILDNNNHYNNPKQSNFSGDQTANYFEDINAENFEDSKYLELDEPELKFCPYCPARFFFRLDLRCHVKFHKFPSWNNTCECCSFSAPMQCYISAHEIVHRDEYAQRTSELLTSGYPVSERYSQPTEYPASVSDELSLKSQRQSWSPKSEVKETCVPEESLESDQQQRRAKRLRYSETDIVSESSPPSEKPQEPTENTSKRQRRSTTIGVKSVSAKPLSPTKTPVAVKSSNSTAIKSESASKPVSPKPAISSTVKKPKPSKPGYFKQFTCDKCPAKFFKISALEYHKGLHGATGYHQCRRCDYTVSTYGNLIRHESIHRDLSPRAKVKFVKNDPKPSKSSKKLKGKPKKTIDPAVKIMPPPPPPPPKQLSSRKTSVLNKGKKKEKKSRKATTKTNEDNEDIDPEFGRSMLGNPDFHYPTTLKNGVCVPKRYKCIKCPTAFDNRDQYVMHLGLHGARDRYRCDKCDYSVRYTANYVQHQRKHARDAEIRRSYELEARRLKILAEQEEEMKLRHKARKRNAANERPKRPLINLNPRDTVFRNEISDRQTAYELNAAYDAAGIAMGNSIVENATIFRCSRCPYECTMRAMLDRHLMHHQESQINYGSSAIPGSSSMLMAHRSWKRLCQFCSYRTYGEADMAEHTRFHFLGSTNPSLEAAKAKAAKANAAKANTATVVEDDDADDVVHIEPRDHVEFHGRRVIYDEDKDKDKGAKAYEPFVVFRDRGSEFDNNGKTKRFTPKAPSPPLLIDFNDNQTDDDDVLDGKPGQPRQQLKTAAFVRFVNNGKRVEFVEANGTVSDYPGGKKKRSRK